MKNLTEGLAENLVKTWLERMPARLPEDQLNCTLQQVSAMQAEIDAMINQYVNRNNTNNRLFFRDKLKKNRTNSSITSSYFRY